MLLGEGMRALAEAPPMPIRKGQASKLGAERAAESMQAQALARGLPSSESMSVESPGELHSWTEPFHGDATLSAKEVIFFSECNRIYFSDVRLLLLQCSERSSLVILRFH